ncbi:MAG: lamin tail domain-containing protein [Brevinematales bacterium]|nr:lamin tail domain-containing protein [Brevinematales bacterium]
MCVFSLRISEVYYRGNLFIPDAERYLEIENDGDEPIDMRKVTLILPRSDTTTVSTTILQGNFFLFDKEAITNEWILPPKRRAVILSEDYNLGGRLLSWDTHTLLFKPKSKTAWGYSWHNRLHLLSLLYDGREVFPQGLLPSSLQEKGKALVYHNGWVEDIPRPGQEKKVRWIAPRVLPTGSLVEIRLESEIPLYEIIKEEYPSASKEVYPLSGPPPYTIVLAGSMTHASTWILRAEKTSHKIRFLDTNLSSPWAGKILISEIMSSPTKDYSGGGWTGDDGGGTVNENDEWLEIANTTEEWINVSNWYLEHTTSQGKGYRPLRLRFDSITGPISTSLLSPKSLGIFSVENGLANKANIVLYDGHPLWGKRVAILAYGEGDIPPANEKNQEKSLQRVPHNGQEDFVHWRLFPPTYGKINGNGPYLCHRWSSTNPSLLEIGMSDPLRENGSLPLLAKSESDEKLLTLTGYCGYFYGTLLVQRTPSPDSLTVKNGGKNTLRYTNEQGLFLWEFVWKEPGWEFPSLGEDIKEVVVYPNPASPASDVFISRLVKGALVVIFHEDGQVIEKRIVTEEAYLVWHTPTTSGLYCILVSYGGRSVYRWVLVK